MSTTARCWPRPGEPRLVKALPDGSGLDTTFGDGGTLHDITHLGVDCTDGYHGPATLLSAEPDGSILMGFSDQIASLPPPLSRASMAWRA